MKVNFSSKVRENVVSLVLSGIILLTFYFIVKNFNVLRHFFSFLNGILFPFILGFAIAFLLMPVMKLIEEKLLGKVNFSFSIKRKISAFSSVILMFVIIYVLLSLVIPQIISSVITLANQLHDYIELTSVFVEDMMMKYNLDSTYLTGLLDTSEDVLQQAITLVINYLPQVINNSVKVFSFIINIFVSIIVAVYILLGKEKFEHQFKKLLYALLSTKAVERILSIATLTGDMFNNFIVGKAIDSFIIGILCFIGMSLLKMDYSVLISCIIGITNIVPFFGPFIGAIPSVFILFIVDPVQAIWFLIFILLLQQFDGNILGPLILGNSTGLPGFWTMFAIVVGGGLFGITGMFFGVPFFAVIYTLTKEWIDARLKEKQIEV